MSPSRHAPGSSPHETLFLVTGLGGGTGVFVGRGADERSGEPLALEGKAIHASPGVASGSLAVSPFATRLWVPLAQAGVTIHELVQAKVRSEAGGLLGSSGTRLTRSSSPELYGWIVAALGAHRGPAAPVHLAAAGADPGAGEAPPGTLIPHVDPFVALYRAFLDAAEELRRALFDARRVETSRELDPLTELVGDLRIEIGKVANHTVVRLKEILRREPELAAHLESAAPWPARELAPEGPGGRLAGGAPALAGGGGAMGGWLDLFARLGPAKAWARAQGKAELVGEFNELIKTGVFAVNELILDHQSSLDTLTTEAVGQYGIERFPAPPGTAGGGASARTWSPVSSSDQTTR